MIDSLALDNIRVLDSISDFEDIKEISGTKIRNKKDLTYNKYKYFKESGDESRVPPTKVLNSAQGCNSILPREFELISKQMEPQDTSSGCWSGGSTIQGRGNTKNTGNTTLW